MELEIDPSGITLTNTYTNTNTVSIDSSNIDISGTHKITLNDTNGITVNSLTIQPTNTLGSATNVTIDEISHLSGVTSNIQTQFNNIIDGAPGVLDTLNELATAINGDAAFATTITTSIDSKVSKTGDETISGNKTFSGDINFTGELTQNGSAISGGGTADNVSSTVNYTTYAYPATLSLYGTGNVFNNWDQRYGGVSLVGSQTDRGFGKRVRFSGNGLRLAISEPYYDGNQGRVRVYNIAQYGSASYGGNNIISQYGSDIPAEVNSQNYSGFGLAINDDGTIVAVGSPYNHNVHARAGTVKVYQNTGSGWSQLGSDFDNTTTHPDALRGFSISLNSNGTRILIGTFNNPGHGRVEIFDWDGSSWNTVGTGPNGPGRIHGGSSGNERWLGRCVSLSSNGNRLAAGSQDHPSGRIEIWDLISGTWTESITLNIGDTEGGPEDYFALSGNGQYLIYGECGDDTNGTDRGVVKVLTLGSNSYTQRGSSIYGTQNGANFGKSVSINYDGSVIAVGACDTDTNSTNSGYVKTYEWNGTDWALKGSTFEDGTNNETHRFGENVSLSNSGSHLAIGIPKAPDNGVIKGTVKVYEFIQWVQGIGVNSNYEYAKMTSVPSGSGSNFERHKAYARSLGGDLASIHNADENAMVHSFTDSGGTYLIGLERDNPTNTWSWSDGTTFDYNNIDSGENNQLTEDYAGIGYEDSGQWSTHSSGESRAIYKRPITTQVVSESIDYVNTIDASNIKLNNTTLTSNKEINIDNINTKIDISGDNLISISDASGIVVNNLTITPEGSFDICGGNFTISVDELSKLDGISENIQSQINTAIAGNIWDQNVTKAFYNTGNVGIGTDNPTSKFQVKDGSISVSGGSISVSPGSEVNGLQFHSSGSHANNIEWYNSTPAKRVLIGSSADYATQFRFWENGSQNFIFLNDSNNTKVGINRTDPQYALDVTGDIRFSGNLYQGTSTTPFSGSGGGAWTESNGNVSRSSGNVGIGFTTPSYKLSLGTSFDSDPNNARIALYEGSAAYGGKHFYGLGIIAPSGNEPGLALWGGTSNALPTESNVDVMISRNGNVGIGKVNPTEKLDVTGNIKASGTITSGAGTLATETYVNTQVTNLIGGAPGALDTLNELAAAIGDDANYASSITTSLAGKVSTTGDETISGNKTFSGDSEFNNINFTGTLTQNGTAFTSGGGSSGGSKLLNYIEFKGFAEYDFTEQGSTNSQSRKEITQLTLTVTPSKTSSKIHIQYHVSFTSRNNLTFIVSRTINGVESFGENNTLGAAGQFNTGIASAEEVHFYYNGTWIDSGMSSDGMLQTSAFQFIDDTHNTTDNVIYKLYVGNAGQHSGAEFRLNARRNSSGVAGTDGYYDERGTSSIVAIEYEGSGSGGNSGAFQTSESNAYYNSGNVGIGTTTPQSELHIHSTNQNEGAYITLESDGGIGGTSGEVPTAGLIFKTNDGTPTNPTSDNATYLASKIYSSWQSGSGAWETSYIGFQTHHSGQGLTDSMIIKGGRVGISKNNPGYLLDVAGDINFTGTLYQNGSAFSGGSGAFTSSSGKAYYTGGNVGIGLTDPAFPLEVQTPSDGTGLRARFDATYRTDFRTNGININPGNSTLNHFAFAINDSEKMRLHHNGNVGIGTSNPICRFTVGNSATSNEGTSNSMAILAPGEDANAILYLGTQHKNNHSSGYATGIGKAAIIAEGKNTYSRSNLHFCLNTAANNNISASLSDSKMTILNEGNVGIGTTTPNAKLDISTPDSVGTTTSVLNFRNTSNYGIYAESDSISGRGNTLDFKSRDYNVGNNDIRNILSLRPEGNVGIGTTNPTALLELTTYGSSTENNLKLSRWHDNNYYSIIKHHVVPEATYIDALQFIVEGGNDSLANNETVKMTITSVGNVGIGTTNPSEKLTVQDDNIPRVAMFKRPSATNSVYSGWENSNSLAYMGIDGEGLCDFEPGALLMGVWRDKPIIFTTGQSNTEKMRITSDGKVGIGTLSPYTPLHIRSVGTSGQVLKVSNTAANSSAWIELECLAGSGNAQQWGLNSAEGGQFRIYKRTGIGAGTWALNIDGDGKVGIGDTTPSYKLDVAGDINFTGTLYQNGSAFSGGSGAFTSGSGKAYYTGGNVGIGTTNPTSLLHIRTDELRGNTNTTNKTMLELRSHAEEDCGTYNWNPISIDFHMSNSNSGTNIARIAALMCPTGGSSHATSTGERSNALTFHTCNGTESESVLSEKMRIRHDGHVGIGTTNPLCPLHVKGVGSSSNVYTSVYTDYWGGGAGSSTWHSKGTRNRSFGLITENNIWCQGSEIHLTSDLRIKTDISNIDDDRALQQVNALESKEYHYIDPMRRRDIKTIGFIAQEVKEVIPNAVSIQSDIIPDELRIIENPIWIDCSYSTIRYEPKTTYTETISYQEGPMLDESGNPVLDQCGNQIMDPTAVQVVDPSGTEHIDPSGIVIEEWHPKWKLQIPDLDMSSNNTGHCRFYFSNDPSGNDEIMKELVLDPSSNNTFEAMDERYNNVFFYGKEVDDFHTLDKAQIFALHHSAIQELSRKNDTLVSEKETMQTQITTLLEENNSMKTRLEALEAAIINLQNS